MFQERYGDVIPVDNLYMYHDIMGTFLERLVKNNFEFTKTLQNSCAENLKSEKDSIYDLLDLNTFYTMKSTDGRVIKRPDVGVFLDEAAKGELFLPHSLGYFGVIQMGFKNVLIDAIDMTTEVICDPNNEPGHVKLRFF